MSTSADRAASLVAARALRQHLQELGLAEAPATLLGNVLDRIGLAEQYLSLSGTPIGTVYVAFNGRRISGVAPARDDASFERTFHARTGRSAHRAEEIPSDLLASVERHLAGQPANLELDLRGLSEFERAVLLKAREIPRGEVRPYGWIAREIGRPGAVRAVGSALNKNPIPLLIPCHRVVRSDGQIGEYAFGPSFKRALLASEGLDVEMIEALAQARTRFVGDEESGLYCLPSCQRVRGRSLASLQRLTTAAAAHAGGYRPCPTCRPAVAEAVG